MLSKSFILVQLIVVFLADVESGFDNLCTESGTFNSKPHLMITFGSKTQNYYTMKPLDFHFNTSLQQEFDGAINDGRFGFVNAVPETWDVWHRGALDHTLNDDGGYMFFANVGENQNAVLFESVVNNLCIGLRYEFSAHLTNVDKNQPDRHNPAVRFEVRSNTHDNHLLAQFITGDLPQYSNLTWLKYGVPFIASNSSVVLSIISTVTGVTGNDMAIDDIEVSVCPTEQCGYCRSETISTVASSDVTSITTSPTTTLQTTTETHSSAHDSKLIFVPKPCQNSAFIGANCNTLNNICEVLQPCEHNSNCTNNKTATHGYVCSCPPGFSGLRCEHDHRLCKPHTCLNNGVCNETSNTTYHCIYNPGWQGDHCQSMEHTCETTICMNNGVCRPSPLGYTCECLGHNYYDRHCEMTAKKTLTHKILSKITASTAILIMVIAAMFVVIMDVLKYCFGIDLTRQELQRYRQERQARKRAVIERGNRVNASSPLSDKAMTTMVHARI